MPQLAKNLLLADDDEDDIILFQLALKEACIDYELTIVKDGDELLKMLSENIHPDVILLDINMPRVSGIECLDKIRSDEAYDKIPIIILTTGAPPEHIQYCLSNGANKFFKKPCSIYELSLIVKNICDEYIN